MLPSCLSLLCDEEWGFIDIWVRLDSQGLVNILLGVHARLQVCILAAVHSSVVHDGGQVV